MTVLLQWEQNSGNTEVQCGSLASDFTEKISNSKHSSETANHKNQAQVKIILRKE